MEFCSGQDVLDNMTWTVFDDKKRPNGADAATIRQQSRSWAEAAVQYEPNSDHPSNLEVLQ